MDTQKPSRVRVRRVGINFGVARLVYNPKKSGAAMPLVISLTNRVLMEANDDLTQFERDCGLDWRKSKLADMAGIDPLAGTPDGLVG